MATISHVHTVLGDPTKLNIYAGAIGGSVLVRNTSDQTVWIGDQSISPDNGFPIYPADTIAIPVGENETNPVDVWVVRRSDELHLPGIGVQFSNRFDFTASVTVISRVA